MIFALYRERMIAYRIASYIDNVKFRAAFNREAVMVGGKGLYEPNL